MDKCNSCGIGTRGDRWGHDRCSWCGAPGSSFEGDEHVHRFGLRVNGYAACVGRRALGCSSGDYDSQWGAGMFSDWRRGESKPYGA